MSRTTTRAPSRHSPSSSRRSPRSTPRSWPTISARFAALDKLVDGYRSTSDTSGYVPYTALSAADKRNLAAAVKAVQEPLSKVASKVANA